jgi:hypothetical protein
MTQNMSSAPISLRDKHCVLTEFQVPLPAAPLRLTPARGTLLPGGAAGTEPVRGDA